MDSHSIFNYRTLFSALSSISCFSPFCLFLPHAFVPGAQKNRICRAGRPCFFENFRLS